MPWVEGGTINTSISPLSQLFDPASSSNWEKLKGYSKLRGTLHLKIEINASPFHFGALNVSWAPLTTELGNNTVGKINYDCLNSFSGASLSSYGANFTSGTSSLMRVTQRLNGYIFPQDGNSLDFEIPFLYPKEFIELRAIPDAGNSFATNSKELLQYGSLVFMTAVPLLVAQTLTGGIATVNVFAWMTDVELEGPSFVLTSGIVAAAGSVATSFKDVPIIGGYLAKAGAISKASAKVLSLLGMSNYPDESPTTHATLSVLPGLTATEINSDSRYLGLAPHSGLTLAPTESWSDELQIDQFGKSPVYLGLADWTISNGAGTELFDANVSPEYYHLATLAGVAAGSTYAVTSTPACYVSSMFNQWRGKIKYHFTAVASQYHRGRLRMFYDSSVNIISGPKEGFVFSKIWDITETKNFEFEVPFTASTQMLSLQHPQYTCINIASSNYTFASSGLTQFPPDPRFHNGSVSLQVLNRLLGPNAQGVKIICSVSYEGLEFAEPCAPGSYPNPGAATPGAVSMNLVTLAHDYYTTSAVPSDHKPFNAEIYNGEKVLSLRTLLHRSSEYAILGIPRYGVPSAAGGETGGSLVYPREPLSPGEHTYGNTTRISDSTAVKFANNLNTSSVTLAAVPLGYNYVAMSPFVFLKGMFAGYRGSFRWKYLSDAPATMFPGNPLTAAAVNHGVLLSLTANRSRAYTSGSGWTDIDISGTSTSSAASNFLRLPFSRPPMNICGAECNTSVFGNTLSVDVPQYSRFKFLPTNDVLRSFVRNTAPSAKLGSVSGLDGIYDVATDSIELDFKFYNPAGWGSAAANGLVGPKIRSFVSCGTDFSFVGFINTPIVYVKASLPAASLT